MDQPYIGQVFMLAFDFAPRNYSLCSGQILAINQNQALFSILSTTYGGNGSTTFALPDLRGRTPVNMGAAPGLSPFVLGQTKGLQSRVLDPSTLPPHNHSMLVSAETADGGAPTNLALSVGPVAGTTAAFTYTDSAPNTIMNPAAIAPGGGKGLPLMQPYLVINFAVALYGVYPSRN